LDVPVIIAASPQLDFVYDSAVCIPAIVQFTGVWQNPDTTVNAYRWDFGNGQSSTSLVPSPISYNAPATLNIRFSAINNYGCTGEIVKPLIVNDTPRVSADPNAFICLGQAATLRAGGALTYQWDADATLSCTNCATPAARPSQNRIYRVTGTDVNGCQSSDTVLIRVKLPGNLTVGLGDTICVGETVQLRAAGYELFSWSPAASLNNARIANPLARPTSTTNYVVTGTDSLGCFTDTAIIPVIVYPIPQIDIAESIIKGIQGSSVPLRIIGSPDITRYLWSPATDLSCITCPEPTAQINRRITYTLTATNNGGCVSQDNVRVEPFCTGSTVFLPNTFSPNGDGNNDVFYPRGVGDISIKSIRIFNRWGELMYERKDFKINDPTAGWNGTYKGAALTPDVYVYVAEVQCGNNELYSMKGNVTLLK
jgi:gliding motility-associated-like protein